MPQIMETEIFDTAQLHRSTKRTSKMAVVKQGERVTWGTGSHLNRTDLGFALEDIERETVDRPRKRERLRSLDSNSVSISGWNTMRRFKKRTVSLLPLKPVYFLAPSK